MKRAGADVMITPREIIRDYITLLNILMQNPTANAASVLKTNIITFGTEKKEEASQNTDFDPEDIEI